MCGGVVGLRGTARDGRALGRDGGATTIAGGRVVGVRTTARRGGRLGGDRGATAEVGAGAVGLRTTTGRGGGFGCNSGPTTANLSDVVENLRVAAIRGDSLIGDRRATTELSLVEEDRGSTASSRAWVGEVFWQHKSSATMRDGGVDLGESATSNAWLFEHRQAAATTDVSGRVEGETVAKRD